MTSPGAPNVTIELECRTPGGLVAANLKSTVTQTASCQCGHKAFSDVLDKVQLLDIHNQIRETSR